MSRSDASMAAYLADTSDEQIAKQYCIHVEGYRAMRQAVKDGDTQGAYVIAFRECWHGQKAAFAKACVEHEVEFLRLCKHHGVTK
ncbi:MAG: hypothetical protein ACRCYB_12710 [Aeromonas veronii]